MRVIPVTGDVDFLGTWGRSSASVSSGMLLLHELGRRLRHAPAREGPEGSRLSVSVPSKAARFGLLGLLLAFTGFSGAATRFDARRHLVTEEGTTSRASLDARVLWRTSARLLRANLRDYLIHGSPFYDKLPHLEA